MSWNQKKIEEVYVKAQKLAATDETFRKELLQNPCVAISTLAGEDIPESFSIRVIENDPTYAATFVLPPLVINELTGEDLQAVAGGDGVEIGYDPDDELWEECIGINACAAKASASCK